VNSHTFTCELTHIHLNSHTMSTDSLNFADLRSAMREISNDEGFKISAYKCSSLFEGPCFLLWCTACSSHYIAPLTPVDTVDTVELPDDLSREDAMTYLTSAAVAAKRQMDKWDPASKTPGPFTGVSWIKDDQEPSKGYKGLVLYAPVYMEGKASSGEEMDGFSFIASIARCSR
jgi:hypothetical protein